MATLKFIKRPMLFSAVIASVLTVLAFYFEISLTVSLVLLTAACVLLLIFTKRYDLFIALLFTILILFSAKYVLNKADNLSRLDGVTVNEEVVVLYDAQKSKSGYYFTDVKITSGKTMPKGTEFNCAYGVKEQLRCGEKIRAVINISALDKNAKKSGFADGQYITGFITQYEKTGKSDKVFKFIGDVRRYAEKSAYEFLNGDTAANLIAVTTGNKSFLSETYLNNVRTAGVSHILVVSGMHLAILLGGVFSVINYIFKNKYLRFVLSIFLVLFIAFVCGFTKSILRAGIMYLILCAAPLFNRGNEAANTLGAAVVLVLLFSPFAIFSVSFELSALATYAIVEISPFVLAIFTEKLKLKSKFLISALKIVLNTLLATAFTLPVIIYCFGKVSVISPITNILVAYAVTLLLSFGAVGLLIPEISVLFYLKKLLFKMSGICSAYIVFVVNSLSKLPFAAAKIGTPYLILSVAVILGLIAFMYIYKARSRKKFLKGE